ncbi:DUF192 domain-containing protein [Sinorhizobium meliloti]|jgi:uncharacterized protein|uniref:DUF192 domain-containing protein n=3 Tax=Rhizobium meliloti TaxID=382 RepID=F7X8N9_SINMM|nr:DUF192 domain-containing protein [Sinorhizobium meliloti]PST25703.1 DUF192 domain-containing protein [Mesorhizobium loti]TWB03399.1 hypothetical protein FB000_104263 [Ensifer sp. SEMIA 134]TWB39282.1 hypothetical protein FB001_10365 [Ensifer sp. SEMIA 135]AEG04382.1 protein of unknown function DUF192 [Sinorhizobium meliloti BL225C]AEG53359.1 protein of unknown function DUF192 [Sinorhizobium meliloti AK83]
MSGVVGIAARSALTALFLLLLLVASAMAEVSYAKERVRLITASGRTHDLTVELAVDPSQREQGLMYRRQMAPDHGMLFDFGETRPVMMWMKNTYLPLDMLFIASDGTIRTIHENAVPHSEAIIDSREPVAYVLELNAGTVKRLGVSPGDRLEGAGLPATKRAN